MDPRVRATPAELADQFRWGQQAFDKMIQAREAVLQIQALQAALDKVHAASNSNLTSATKSAEEKSGRILTGGERGRDQGLRTASRSLTIVLTAIESADRTPPSQVIELYRQAEKVLEGRLAEWNSFKQSVLPDLNRQLRSAGMPAVQLSMLEQEAQDSLSK
jgi:hypothetical protein